MTSLLPTPEPPDPVEGALGHFEHSNWVKAALKALDQGTLHSAGGAVSGMLNAESITVNDPASEDAFVSLFGNRNLAVQGRNAAGLLRWSLNLGDGTAEGGNNSGSLFGLFAYSDAGAQLHQVLKASRSDGLLEVKGSPTAANGIATKKYVDDAMPIGAIIAYGGSAAPEGWHLCNGTAHGSAALQALIGSANTPDLSGRFIVGAGTGYAPKSTGGAETVTLTAAQSGLPSHAHTASSQAETQEHQHLVDPPATATGTDSANHSHHGWTGGMNRSNPHAHSAGWMEGTPNASDDGDVLDSTGPSQGYVRWSLYVGATDINHEHEFNTEGVSNWHTHTVDIAAFWSGGRSATHTHGITVAASTAANAAQAHENRPPYYALVYIIKKV